MVRASPANSYRSQKLCLECAYNTGTPSQLGQPRSASVSIGAGVESQNSRSGARQRFGAGLSSLSTVEPQAEFVTTLGTVLLEPDP